MIVYGAKGRSYEIEDKPSIGSGGEGGVYSIVGIPDQVIKIYHPGKTTLELEKKLLLMTKKPPNTSVLNQVAWPLDVIYDSNKSFVGFLMPRLTIDTELGVIYRYPVETNISYKQRLIIGQNICAVISEVHKAGYIFGDFNPRNIGIDSNTGTVAFLDTDTYHIVVDKSTNDAFRCNVCAPGYAAPELLDKCARHIAAHPEDSKAAYAKTPLDTFTKETDYFALAIHLFRLLMNGFSPFGGIKENESASVGSPGTGDEAVRRDSYCFKPGNKPQAAAVPSIDEIPQEIADLFTRAFILGRISPEQRPDAVEWYRALRTYEDDLINCNKNPSHMYMRKLAYCPWCEADNRYKNAISPKLRQRTFQNPITPNLAQTGGGSTGGNSNYQGGSGQSGGVSSGGSTYKIGGTPSSSVAKQKKNNITMWIIVGIIIMVWFFLLRGCMSGESHDYYSNSASNNGTVEKNYDDYNLKQVDGINEKEITVTKADFVTHSGKIKGDKEEVFKFNAPRKGQYRFRFSKVRDGSYFWIRVCKRNGKEIDDAYCSNEDGLTTKLKKAKYQIHISKGSGSGKYKLTIGIPKEKKNITNVTSVKDSIQFEDQDNRYSFTAPENGTYRFELSEIHDEKYMDLSIENDLGEVMDSSYGQNGDGVTVELKAKKKYTIHVKYGSGCSQYNLFVGKQKKPIDFSGYDGVQDMIEYSDQDNIYYYTASEGGDCSLTFFDLVNESHVELVVYNRLGERILEESYCGNDDNYTLENLNSGETYRFHVSYCDDYTPYKFAIERS